MPSPLVSIVMPVLNGERYLAEALDSIRAQTHPAWELLVVDGGSTDATEAIAAGYDERVRFVRLTDAGSAAARNHGVALARGAFLAFVDADDLWPDERLARQLAVFEAEDLDIVSGHIASFYSPDMPEEERARTWCPAEPRPGHLATAMLIRRAAFERIGPFETQWRVGIDFTWYARAIEQGIRMRILDDVVLHRRLHSANYGRVHQDLKREHLHILKAVLDRKRLHQAGAAETRQHP